MVKTPGVPGFCSPDLDAAGGRIQNVPLCAKAEAAVKGAGIWNKRFFRNIFDKTLEAEEGVRQAELCLEDSDTEETRL